MGVKTEFSQVLADMKERDARDSGRTAAPLRKAEGAVLVDTTEYCLESSFDLMLRTVRERLG